MLTDEDLDGILAEYGMEPISKLEEYAREGLFQGGGEANDVIEALLAIIRRLQDM